MRKTKIIAILSLGLVGLFISSCATIMQSTTQDLGVSSSPIEATVKLNGVIKGETPLTLEVKRKSAGVIRIEKDGYEPSEIIYPKLKKGEALLTLEEINSSNHIVFNMAKAFPTQKGFELDQDWGDNLNQLFIHMSTKERSMIEKYPLK